MSDHTPSEPSSRTARVRAILEGQLAPRPPAGGVQALWRCPSCGKPWLMNGPHAQLRLSGEELAEWVARLGADLGRLPYAQCRLCAITQTGVEMGVDEYGQGRGGWGVSLEAMSDDGAPIHLLGSVFSQTWMEQRRLAGDGMECSVVTRLNEYRRAWRWVALALRMAQAGLVSLCPFEDEDGVMARDNQPGFGLARDWVWRGALIPPQGYFTHCPALGDQALVSVAMAMPAPEPLDAPALLRAWVMVAERASELHLAGGAG